MTLSNVAIMQGQAPAQEGKEWRRNCLVGLIRDISVSSLLVCRVLIVASIAEAIAQAWEYCRTGRSAQAEYICGEILAR